MKKTIFCREPLQAHKALTAVLWPLVKSWLLCGGGALVVTVKPETRSLEQNARLWAMLTDIADQVIWHGRKLSPEEWKHVFTAALKRQDVVPGLDGGFVVLGLSTSKMTRREMGDLQTLMEAFGSERGVIWSAVEGCEWQCAA
jgi:hypothetical protein